ncbi:DnaA ATPase domain-containing protein [Candidatus Avelusimicrobium luingense]|uniref:DnaA ATPase domain-containing protein n=1 Tax=Candidatus Avelusimicrobium luingense TaxID=3416211 RepID=UPI003D0FD170
MITNWDIISQSNSIGNAFTLVIDGTEQDVRLIARKLAGYVQTPKAAQAPFTYAFGLPSNLDETTLEKIRTAVREVVAQSGKINEFAAGGNLGSPLFNGQTNDSAAKENTPQVDINPQDSFLSSNNTPTDSGAASLEEVFQDKDAPQEEEQADSNDLPFSDKDMLIKDMEDTLLGKMPLQDIFSAETKYDMFLDVNKIKADKSSQTARDKKLDQAENASGAGNGFNIFDQKIKDQTSILDLDQLNAMAETLPEQNAVEQEVLKTSSLLKDLSVQSIQPDTEETIRVDAITHVPCPVPEEMKLENTVPPAELVTQNGQDNLPDITPHTEDSDASSREVESLEKTFNLEATISTEVMRSQFAKSQHTEKELTPQTPDVPENMDTLTEENSQNPMYEVSTISTQEDDDEESEEVSVDTKDMTRIDIPDDLDVTPQPILEPQPAEQKAPAAAPKAQKPEISMPEIPILAPKKAAQVGTSEITPDIEPITEPKITEQKPAVSDQKAPSGKTILHLRTPQQPPATPTQDAPIAEQPESIVTPAPVAVPQPEEEPLKTAPSGKTILRLREQTPSAEPVAPAPTTPRTPIMPKKIVIPSVTPPAAPKPVAPSAPVPPPPAVQPPQAPVAPAAPVAPTAPIAPAEMTTPPAPPAIPAVEQPAAPIPAPAMPSLQQSSMPEMPSASATPAPQIPEENDPMEKTKTIDYSIELPLSELKKHNWPLEVPLLPTYTLENLVLSVNRFAHATAISVLDNPGKMYNPLVFHGTTGTGKTHFLNAMAYGFSKKFGQENIFMTNGVRLSRGIQRYALEGNMEKFEKFMDTVKVLLIDDIHLLAINEQNRAHISKLLNKFLKEQKQIVVTSKYPPESLGKLEDLIQFHLDSGWISELKAASGHSHFKIVKTMLMGNGVDLTDAQISQFFNDTHMTLSAIKRSIHRLKVLENLIFPHIDESQRSQADMLEKLLATTGEDPNSELLTKEPASISSISTVGNGEWGRIGFFYPSNNSSAMNWMVYALEQRAKELGISGGFDIAVRSSYSTENIISSAFKIANLCDNKKLHGAVILGPALNVCEPSVRENFYDILTHMLEIMLIRCGVINTEAMRLPSTYVKVIAELLR